MSSSVTSPSSRGSSPSEELVWDLEPESFYTQTQQIMVDICRFVTLQQTRQQGTTPFDFISEAAMIFLHDPENGLEAMKKQFEAPAKLHQTKSPEVEADHNDNVPPSAAADFPRSYSSLYYLALQIINTAIAQCFEVFGGVALEQPTRLTGSGIPWNNTIEERAEFLRSLFTRVETQERLSEEDIDLPNVVQACDNPNFRYKERLNSSLGEVRVATVAPGTGDDPVECQLSVRDLTRDGLHETLSYVWGSGPASHTILVDGKEFKVRDSLYLALKTLRRPDAARQIWIDALCINQADNEERTSQVKLMQRIYAVSSKTTIWFGDDVPEVEEDFPFDDMEKPLHDWLGEPAIDENDLPSMLEFCRKLSADFTTGLKEEAHGRLTGEEGDKAAKRYRTLSRRAMEYNVSPVHTFVERTAREFVTKHGGTFPMDQWFFGKTRTALATSQCDSKQLDGYLWAGKLMAAMVSLCRCVAVLLSHSWWERMWVIQESYLPRAPPDIYFKGSLFSWKDLEEAIDICKELIIATNYSYLVTPQEELDSLSEDTNTFFHHCFAFAIQLENLASKAKLSFRLREEKAVDDKLPYWRRERLVDTLEQTAPYKAAMPVDKIFALQSLFNPVMGSLMDLNYDRPVSDVFGKTTRQAATNSADLASLVKRFAFLTDDKGPSGSRQPWPSWVLDFTHSDAEQRRVDDAVVEFPTFEGALFSAANAIGDSWTPKEYLESGNVFFTPKILYCYGMCVPTDDAFSIKLSPPGTDEDPPQWYGFRNIFREDLRASLSPYLGEPHLENPMIKHLMMGAPFPDFSAFSLHEYERDLDSSDDDDEPGPWDDEKPGPWGRNSGRPKPWRKVPRLLRPKRASPLSPGDTTDGSVILDADRSVSNELGNSWLRGLHELWSLGYNRSEGAVWSIADPNRPPIVSLASRGWECEGKHAIFLDTGLSALSYAAYEKGDVFAMLCGTGVFLHLRPVGRAGDDSQHRIVSRLLVAGTLKGEVTSLFEKEGAYMREFEIV